MSLLCKLLGHKLVLSGENMGIASAFNCARCGHCEPAIVWPRGGADECNGMLVTDGRLSAETLAALAAWMESPKAAEMDRGSMKPSMAESHRVPPMPACKPPAEMASNADLMCEIKALREEMMRMRTDVASVTEGRTV